MIRLREKFVGLAVLCAGLVSSGLADCPCETQSDIIQLAANTKAEPVSTSPPVKNSEEEAKYLDPSVPIEERINDLLPRLTLQEKVVQLSDDWGSKGIPRLKIPALLKTEGLHGQSYSHGATIFPMPIQMASTFDTNLINQIGVATAVEAKAANLRASWSPVLDVARDARWGRVEETYGEDPWLVSRMGVAWISGFQSQNMIAVPKHFAGHGEPLGGRDSNDVGVSDRAMRSIHLVPFRAAIEEAHAGGVMAAYSTWDGTPNNASRELLRGILRQEWEFNGIVVSDCGAPEQLLTKQTVVTNLEEACRLAILAGVDSECGAAFKKALVSAVQKGFLKESDLDVNVRDMLRAKFKLGLFEDAGRQNMVWDKLPAYDTPEHRALAREVAVEGSVLLKNEGGILPLSKELGTIAVIGPNADIGQIGDYSGETISNQVVTVLQGIKTHVSASTKILYARGCDPVSQDTSGIAEAVEIAKQADAVILVVGDKSGGKGASSGENNDGATLEIPGVQRELIKQVRAAGKPLVLVLVNGKPFTLAWESKNVPAILETWYPGEEGGNATVDIIFGDRNPSGRLPITFPRHAGQLPLRYNYLPSGRSYAYYDMPFTPQYRFGFGLSYTTFKYSNLSTTTKEDGAVVVSAEVQNTGTRDGDEVAQLYVTDVYTSVITPVIEQKGFQRIALKKGEQKTVSFTVTPYQLSFLDADMARVVEPSVFRIHVGGVSPEPPSGGDNHKLKIGFKDPSQGVSGDFHVAKKFQADFVATLAAPGNVHREETFPVEVTVRNRGNLTDVVEVKLFGASLLDTHRFEIDPGQTKSCTFSVAFSESGTQNLTAIVGKTAVTQAVKVSKATAKKRDQN